MSGRRNKEEGKGKKTLGTGKMPVPDCGNLQRFKSRLQLMSIAVLGDRLPLKEYSKKLV